MFATTTSRFAAMTAEDRQSYWRWARWVVGVYGTAWLVLSLAVFAAAFGS